MILRIRARQAAWRCAAALLIAGACGAGSQRDLLREAESLVLEGRFTEAIPVLKQRLMENPGDAGAHYYLGRCYLYTYQQQPEKAWFGIAEGEFETALALFRRGGRVCPVPRFNNDSDYFEISCHVEIIKIYLLLAEQVIANAVRYPPPARDAILGKIVEKGETHLGMAKAVNPEHGDVKLMESLIEQVKQARALPGGSMPGRRPRQGEFPGGGGAG